MQNVCEILFGVNIPSEVGEHSGFKQEYWASFTPNAGDSSQSKGMGVVVFYFNVLPCALQD